MKPKENFLEDLLIVKESDNPEEKAKIFPLGYTDKREVKRKKKKHGRKSRHSSKSSSSESIEEKNEDLEEDNFNFLENNSDPMKKKRIINKRRFRLGFRNNRGRNNYRRNNSENICGTSRAKSFRKKSDRY